MTILLRIFKNLVKMFLLLISAVVLALAWLVFIEKGVSPLLVWAFLITAFLSILGLLWPAIFQWIFSGRMSRKRIFRWFGVPAALLGAALYAAVIFYVEDIPVLFGIFAFLSLIGTLVSLSRTQSYRQGWARRSAPFAGLLIVSLVFAFVSPGWVKAYKNTRFTEAAAQRQQIIESTPRRTPEQDGQIKVYTLHVGSTVVTYGQFYGGLDGWEGLPGYFQTLINKNVFAVPVYAFLIDHPVHGLILIDAGVNWEQAHDHDGYYNHNYMVSRLLTERNEYQLAPEQELEVQVARLGYRVEDIRTVFLTHVHEDHAGGLRLLSGAKVVFSEEDWKNGTLYPYSFELVDENIDLVTYDSGPFAGFPASQDYFGDGSIVMLATPGHSPGHSGILLQMEDYQILFVGDTPYTLRHLAVDQVRQMMIGGIETEKQIDAILNTRRFVENQPETILLFAHDHSDYQFSLVDQSLADGKLSTTEREQIQDYVGSIFLDDWQLAQGNQPYFIPASGDDRLGSVGWR